MTEDEAKAKWCPFSRVVSRVGDGEHARVFWPTSTEWVDAMPRRATEMEVLTTVSKALERW